MYMYVCVPIYTVYYGFVGVPNLKLVRKNHNPSKKRQLKTILSRPKLHETSFLIPPSSSLHEIFMDFKKPVRHERRMNMGGVQLQYTKGPQKIEISTNTSEFQPNEGMHRSPPVRQCYLRWVVWDVPMLHVMSFGVHSVQTFRVCFLINTSIQNQYINMVGN